MKIEQMSNLEQYQLCRSLKANSDTLYIKHLQKNNHPIPSKAKYKIMEELEIRLQEEEALLEQLQESIKRQEQTIEKINAALAYHTYITMTTEEI